MDKEKIDHILLMIEQANAAVNAVLQAMEREDDDTTDLPEVARQTVLVAEKALDAATVAMAFIEPDQSFTKTTQDL